MTNRAELINQLAASMGANTVNTKSVNSRYDTKTGTLYCEGVVITKSIADKAIELFTTLEQKCNKNDPVQNEQALMYKCAIESIRIVQNPSAKMR